MLRTYKKISPQIMKEFPSLGQPVNHNVRHQPHLLARSVKNVYCSAESLGYYGPKTRELSFGHLKNTECLKTFKSSMRKWETNKRLYRLCKTYFLGVEFQIEISILSFRFFNILYLFYLRSALVTTSTVNCMIP